MARGAIRYAWSLQLGDTAYTIIESGRKVHGISPLVPPLDVKYMGLDILWTLRDLLNKGAKLITVNELKYTP